MRSLITVTALALLLLFAGPANADISDSLLVANFSTSVIGRGAPVGTDTGYVTVVTKVEMATGTKTSATVADGLASDSAYTTTGKRVRWIVHIKFYQKNTTPNTDSLRYIYVYGKNVGGSPLTATLATAVEVDSVIADAKIWSDIDSVKYTRYEAGDSVEVFAWCIGGVVSTTTMVDWETKTPPIGFAKAAIQPRQRGWIYSGGLGYGLLKAAEVSGSYAMAGATTAGTVDAVTVLPDSAWVMGILLAPGDAGDLVPIKINPFCTVGTP